MRAPVPAEPVASSAYLAVKATDGLFRLGATRAGQSIELVVDTGATGTILTAADAQALGVGTRGGEEIELLTANGIATMRRVELSGLVVAGRHLPTLRVAIAPAGLAHSLLGQDALSRLGRITIDHDRLEIGSLKH
ncbi:retropepsin-like aspartic protease family protein [Sphingomonas sp.]|uniref:retropepsin-like aspartic protease family protein n=1 Tax=Sphingomonas sp. TaxID=28214 RepID=UPI003B0080B6